MLPSKMKQPFTALLLGLVLSLVAICTLPARAQTVPHAFARGISITAGGEASAFQPDYDGFGIPETSTNRLYGIGAFVDVKFTPWVQIEAEGRWLRFNQLAGIYEDNYLIGPRLPIYKLHFWKATPYGKVLFGYGKLNFEDGNGWGRYTDIAYGGGLDIKLTKRINIRAPDFEFQQWPNWSEGVGKSTTLSPYGVSVGASYRIFGIK
jgi:hypothetical protein